MEFIIKNNKSILAFVMLCFVFMTSCTDGDGDADYGYAYIYIPQATTSGGLNNHYNVPSGAGENTHNFAVENGKLNIYLSVLRSGKVTDASGFTVDVVASATKTNEAVNSGKVSNAVALESNLYTLPSKVTVSSGKESASFFLSLDVDTLKKAIYSGKNLALVVEIANPTHYQLSDQNTSVIVVIDVDAMLSHISSAS